MPRPLLFAAATLCWSLSQPAITRAQLPLGESAPASNILRIGHLGRQIGDIERLIHFYRDLLGTGLNGERDAERRFFTTPGLLEFANTPAQADFRAVILPLPGTAAEPGGDQMTIEAIEFRNMDRHQWVMGLEDIGSSHLVLIMRDLDAALETLKAEGVRIVTEGGEPVELPSRYGAGGTERAIVVRDPDGYPVQLVEMNPAPPTTAEADSNIIGARVSLTVDDLEASENLYMTLVGDELEFRNSPSFAMSAAENALRATPGAEFRWGAALIPGSPVYLEFIEYRGIEQEKNRPMLQDIGTAHVLFMADDMDLVMQHMRAAGLETIATSGKPVYIGPTAPALFTRESNNFFVEFIARRPAQE